MSLEVELTLYPEIKYGDYKALKIIQEKELVTDAELDYVIEQEISKQKLHTEIDREIKSGDFVSFELIPYGDDGIKMEAEKFNHQLCVGKSEIIEDLDKAMIGMKKDEVKLNLPVKYPKDEKYNKLSDKTVNYDIKVLNIYLLGLEYLNEEQTKKLIKPFQDVEKFKSNIKQYISNQKTEHVLQKNIKKYFQELVLLSEFDIPEKWISEEVNKNMNQITQHPEYIESTETFWEENLGMSEKDYINKISKDEEFELKKFLILWDIVDKEKIELNKDELRNSEIKIKQLIKKDTSKKKRFVELLREEQNQIKVDKYIQSIIENKEEEEIKSEQEVLKNT